MAVDLSVLQLDQIVHLSNSQPIADDKYEKMVGASISSFSHNVFKVFTGSLKLRILRQWAMFQVLELVLMQCN